MGFFDKVKQAVSGVASEAIKQAEETATNSVTNSIGGSPYPLSLRGEGAMLYPLW